MPDDICTATMDITSAPWTTADGTVITTLQCELLADDGHTEHAAYCAGRTYTYITPADHVEHSADSPPTHRWRTDGQP